MLFFLTVGQSYGKARKKQKWFSWLELHVGNLLCHSFGLLNNSQGEVFSWESSYLDQKGNLHLGTSEPNDSYQAFPTARRRDISFAVLTTSYLITFYVLQNFSGMRNKMASQKNSCNKPSSSLWSSSLQMRSHTAMVSGSALIQTPNTTYSLQENKK